MCKSKKYTWFIKIIFHINTHLFYRCERGQAGKDREKIDLLTNKRMEKIEAKNGVVVEGVVAKNAKEGVDEDRIKN